MTATLRRKIIFRLGKKMQGFGFFPTSKNNFKYDVCRILRQLKRLTIKSTNQTFFNSHPFRIKEIPANLNVYLRLRHRRPFFSHSNSSADLNPFATFNGYSQLLHKNLKVIRRSNNGKSLHLRSSRIAQNKPQ